MANGTVLLVEDEPNIAMALSFLLERDGWRVAVESDGAAAVDAAERERPAVMILDAMLPGMSGFDILREVRARAAFADLPVLMLTAKGQDRDREAAQRAGADRFMTKPFANDEIVAVVRELAS